MSDRVSCWYFRRCVLVGSSSSADVDFKRWYFSCDGQQRALRDSEAMKFCEQEPAVGFDSVFLSGYRNYIVLISWNDNILGVTFSVSCWSR
ncbi:scarecrow-like protein 3 [Dorcoceras hygrometricum]|uniref:Scarecrow-like protein 3 n=1 Tax=Dorcoceras hygrometricum TaxID=472368 RepID=A0A2Z7BBR7_9LAMI|nr:scarecrow-like protein 3 [Dorcoceras hygrometricum]